MLKLDVAKCGAVLLAFALLPACTPAPSVDLFGEQAGIPSDYPQLSQLQFGRADLVVDGVPYDAGDGFGAFDGAGVDATRLRLDMDFDSVLQVEVLNLAVDAYAVNDGQVEARWWESFDDGEFTADTACGGGAVNIVGSEPRETLSGDQHLLWGTIQLRLCNEGAEMEISGRFSVVVIAI